MSRRLVGRVAELAAVESFLDDVPARALLELEGEPGIGKSALWDEACERARRRGYRVLSSRPGELETMLAYAALGDLVEDIIDEAVLSLPAPRGRALERALLRVDQPGRPPDHRAIGLAVRDTLRHFADDPLVIAIDDVQWLDASSASVLAFALRRIGEATVGVLLTSRIGESRAPAARLGGTAGLAARTIRLAPLDELEVEELVRAQLGTALSRPVLREVHRVSGGNPFFAIELARAAQEGRGSGAAGALAVPQSLRDLLGERIGGLPADVRGALLVVAAALHPTVRLVDAVVGRHGGAVELLSAAVAAEILGVERGRLRFRHPLLASIVYGDASPAERRRVHGDLAAAIDDVEERAHHLALATDLPDAAVAGVLDAAATRAASRGAPMAVAGFAEHALRLTEVDDRANVVRRTTVAADALWSAGETARARALLEELAAGMPSGTERARVLRQLARARAYEEGFLEAFEPLERALEEVGDDLGLRAALERDVALAIMNAGDVRLAEPHAQAAVEVAGQVGDPELTADADVTYDSARFLLAHGTPDDLAERARRFAHEGERLDAHPGFLARATMLASLLKWADDFPAARQVLEELRRQLEEREEEGPLLPVLFHLGELECWAGRIAAAAEVAAELEPIAARLGPKPVSQALYLSGLVAALRGDADEANAAATRGLELARGGDVRLVIRNLKLLGFVSLSRGSPGEAHPRLREAAELAAASGFLDPGPFRLTADVIETRIHAGDVERAEREAVELEALGERLDRPWALATGARSVALAAVARGDLARALSALERALAAHERLPDPLERGRTLVALGSVHRRSRHKRLAREALTEATAVFESIPAPLWAEQARREAARIGGRSPTGGELTEVERRIAELVVAGYSNAEAAEALVVSRRTVEWHLSNVYRKLGVRARTQLARRAAAGDG